MNDDGIEYHIFYMVGNQWQIHTDEYPDSAERTLTIARDYWHDGYYVQVYKASPVALEINYAEEA